MLCKQSYLGLEELEKLYEVARVLTEFIAPSEYGMTRQQKLQIGTCHVNVLAEY